MANCYEILGVPSSASSQELRAAFKRRALKMHPDKGGTKEAFQQALLAFEVLSDPVRRARHDRRCLLASPCTIQSRTVACKSAHRTQQANAVVGGMAKARRVSKNLKQPLRHKKQSAVGSTGKRKATIDASTWRRQQVLGGSRSEGITCGLTTSRHGRDIIAKIFWLLQRLSALRRRAVIDMNFTEQQRLALEKWIIFKKDEASFQINSGTIVHANKHASDSESQCNSSSSDCDGEDPPEELTDKENLHCCLESADSSGISSDTGTHSSLKLCWSSDIGVHEGPADILLQEPFPMLEDCAAIASSGASAQLEVATQADNAEVEEKPGEEHRKHTSLRGICRQVHGHSTWYKAVINVESLNICSRFVTSLTIALDFLMVLLSIKQKICSSSGSFTSRVSDAVASALQEHKRTAEVIRLRFRVSFSLMRWFRPRMNCAQYTPFTPDLDHALSTWQRLSAFRWRRGLRVDHVFRWRSGLRVDHTSPRCLWMDKVQDEWAAFREVYLDIMEEAGQCREQVSAKLDALEQEAKPDRESYLEQWNRKAMAAEEQRHRRETHKELLELRRERQERQAMLAEERLVRRAAEHERRCEHRNRQLMCREDRLSGMWHRREKAETCLVNRICVLLRRWQSHEARRADRQRKIALRAAAKSAHKRRQEERRWQESKWRWLQRSDLTMDELLRGYQPPL